MLAIVMISQCFIMSKNIGIFLFFAIEGVEARRNCTANERHAAGIAVRKHRSIGVRPCLSNVIRFIHIDRNVGVADIKLQHGG